MTTKRKSDEALPTRASSGNKYGYLKDIHIQHKFKKQKVTNVPPKSKPEKIKEIISSVANNHCVISEFTQDPLPMHENIKLNLSNELEMQYELLDVEDSKYYRGISFINYF